MLLVYARSARFVWALIVGGGLVPHGDFAYDSTLPPTGNNESARLHNASVETGHVLSALDVDVLVLITPHGVSSERDTGFYAANNASGFAKIGDDLHNASHKDYEVPVNCSIDANLTRTLVAALGDVSNVTALTAWGESEPFPLRWGEGIPLLLLQDGGYTPKRAVVISLPSRRILNTSMMTNEMRRLGRALRDALPDDRRIAVVVSGDLAHTHAPDGPYGYSPDAEPFDQAVGSWLRNTSDAIKLVVDAANLVDDALSCGYLGLVMLLGLLERDAELTKAAFIPARPVVGPYHPTYYGMAVAFLTRHDII